MYGFQTSRGRDFKTTEKKKKKKKKGSGGGRPGRHLWRYPSIFTGEFEPGLKQHGRKRVSEKSPGHVREGSLYDNSSSKS